MAANRPRGKPFAKGKSGNPKGSSAKARNIGSKMAARMTANEVAELGTLLLRGHRGTLQEIGSNPDASNLELMFAACAVECIKTKDFKILDKILDRVIGRSKETHEVTGAGGAPLALELASRQMSEEEMRKRADELARQRKEAGDD